jgi:hypothetical protein
MEFSFDSFLDVVANVVGVIIRLILVVWVGARSYTAAMNKLPPPPPDSPRVSTAPIMPEPPPQSSGEVARRRTELEELETRLAEQARGLGLLRQQTQAAGRIAAVTARRRNWRRIAPTSSVTSGPSRPGTTPQCPPRNTDDDAIV